MLLQWHLQAAAVIATHAAIHVQDHVQNQCAQDHAVQNQHLAAQMVDTDTRIIYSF